MFPVCDKLAGVIFSSLFDSIRWQDGNFLSLVKIKIPEKSPGLL